MNRERIALTLICLAAAAGCGPTMTPAGSRAGRPATMLDAGLPRGAPGDVGISIELLARIRPAMQAYVDDGRLAGVMTMVARRGKVVHWEAVGMRDRETRDPLRPDDIFRIASMTKPVTTVAAMILVEEGKLALTDPVSKFIPEFGRVTVLTSAGTRVPPARPITVAHLMSHTSGLTYGFFGETAVDTLYRLSGLVTKAAGLDDFARRVAELPLLANPGDRWNYSVSTDILGRVVEVVSGQPFDVFVKERITGPLGMKNTGFVVPPEARSRFTVNYRRADGALQTADSPVDGRYTKPPAWLSGGGGLVSTASDYIRFAQMLLQDGRLGEVRILAPATVRMMRANRLPGALVPIKFANYLSPGYGFGLGFAVLVDESATPEADHNGVFRWAGAFNTYFWIDPTAELIAMVWTQMTPFGIYPIEREFQALVYGAIQ